MEGAREFVYVSVMEYFPTTRFTHPVRWVWVRSTILTGKSWHSLPPTESPAHFGLRQNTDPLFLGTGPCWTTHYGQRPSIRVCKCAYWSAAGSTQTPPCLLI